MQATKPTILLSFLYNDWASAEEVFRQVAALQPKDARPLQLVLVDDGSTQSRPPEFLRGVTGFASIEVVSLRRNLGHQRAIAIGLSYIFETKDGDAVAVMDSDGEDKPEDVFRLLAACAAQTEPRIVFAERTRRSETPLFQFFYQIYCALHLVLTGYRIRFGNFGVVPWRWLGCLVVDPNLWLHFAASTVAGRIPYTTIPSTRGQRRHGQSRFNFTGLVIHGLAAISCYSEIVCVRLIFFALGLSTALAAAIIAVLVVRIATAWAVPGWATYTTGVLVVMLLQAFLIVAAFAGAAISNRKSHFFFPLQQYKLLIGDVSLIS